MLLQIFKYKFLCGHMFSINLSINWRVKLLGHTVTLCLTFWGTAKLFSKVTTPFYNIPAMFKVLSSVQPLSHVQVFATPCTAARQASLSIPTPGVYSNSCPLSRWCHSTISSSVVPFSSHPQSKGFMGSDFSTFLPTLVIARPLLF